VSDLDTQPADGREGSYYELALTNGQVFVAVVLFLASLSGAFVAGIWFAREASPRSIVAPGGATGAAAAKPSPEGLDEYRFFSENRASASSSAAPASTAAGAASPPLATPSSPRPDPVTTLADDVGARPGASGTAGAGDEPSTGTAPPTLLVTEPEPKPTATSTPKPAAPVATKPGATDLWVQVFSSADATQARRVVDQLKRAGYRGSVSPAPGSGPAPLQRVRIGPYKDREQAQRVADDVRRKLKFSTWITSTQ
jgi:cell division septation protein DedD